MTKPSEIFDTPEATGFSRVGGNEELVKEFMRLTQTSVNQGGWDIPYEGTLNHCQYDWLRTILTTKDQEKEEAIRAERVKFSEGLTSFLAGLLEGLSDSEKIKLHKALKALPTDDK